MKFSPCKNTMGGIGRVIVLILAILCLAGDRSHAQTIAGGEAGQGASTALETSKVTVHIYPAVTRDDDTAYLYNRGISKLQFAFYTSDKPLDLTKAGFTVDLPSALRVRSVAVIQGWRLKQKATAQPLAAAAGTGLTRWQVPLPERTEGKLVPSKWVSWTGNYCILFLEAGEEAVRLGERPVVAQCRLSGARELEGQELVAPALSTYKIALLPRPAGRSNPSRVPIWVSQRWTQYMDATEFDDNLQLMHELGVTNVDVQKEPILTDVRQRWEKAGISFYDKFQSVIIPGQVTTADKYADPDVYFVGLDGKNIHGTKKYRQTPYCPSSMADPRSPLFKDILAQLVEKAEHGVEYLYSDHELDVFPYCFCVRCRRSFVEHSGIPLQDALNLPPYPLMKKYTLAWYKFRSWQSAQMIVRLREQSRERFPTLKLGLNDGLTYFNQYNEGLGYGYSMFAEDMRVVDDVVDFHNLDALHNSVNDVARLATARPETLKKPVIPRVAGSYSLSWEQGHISARWAYSKQEGRKLGYNRRPEMQRLGMISHIASGARGLEAYIGAHEADAAVQNAADEALGVIARMEDVYLDGKRDDDAVQVVDVTQGESPFLKDDGIISGDAWSKQFWANYGGPYWRVHRWEGKTFITLFNWDPEQAKNWVVRLPRPTAGASVADLLAERVLDAPARGPWTAAQLAEGVAVKVPPLDVVILELSPDVADPKWVHVPFDAAQRNQFLTLARDRQPADQYRFRTNPVAVRNKQDLMWRLNFTVNDWIKRGLVDHVEGWDASVMTEKVP
jgi:hypothetical protein